MYKNIMSILAASLISSFAIAADAEQAATAEPGTEAEAAMEEQSGFSRGSVVRSIFTSAIQDREPIDKLDGAENDAQQIFYFTELRDMSGQTAIHRWEYNGKVMAEVPFNVRGPRWRVWSSKRFSQGWQGDWKVSVLNGAGEVISEELINVAGTDATAGSAAPAADSAPATETPEATHTTTPQ